MLKKFLPLFALIASFMAQDASAATIQINNASIVGTVNWYRTNTYVLNGFVYVESGEVLNIEAGTVIKGAVNNTPATIAALVIARGGKIFANGTANSPIIFTSVLDDVLDPYDLGVFQRGLWGGIVICGKAQLNTSNSTAGNASNPKYDIFEGLADIPAHRYGGNDDDDSSGVLRYVSIRHGGKVLESNKEINGLSLCAVGRGTTIEFVETYATADDGFEFFGGTVNTRYLVSAFNDDDAFDTDQGYRGKNQFWFAIQEPGVRDKGGELNGEPSGIAVGNQPTAGFEVYNATWIGAGANAGGANNNAFTIRDYASPRIYNSIILGFSNGGLSIDSTAGTHLTSGSLDFRNNIWYNFGGGDTVANLGLTANSQVLFTDTARSNIIVNPEIGGARRTATGGLDPRLRDTSPAINFAQTSNDPFYLPANYAGAFDTNNLWIANWTALSFYEVVPKRGHSTVQVNNSSIVGNVTWYRTNTYVLNGMVYVENGETLTIEPGTIIKGAVNNTPATIAALVIARGGKIFANGSASDPIIFTSVLDDVLDEYDLGIYQRGLWGGIVICGKARLNTSNSTAGNASNPKFDVFEGLADIPAHRYGGNDDDDSSGILRYVSIRHGGKVLESNKEINGLSLCAVGRGTTIEFVETYATADDGFEFFGGTVNTRFLVSAFNDDDAFDTDQGFRGKNQFWFAIQEPGVRDKGGELNGEPSGIAVGNQPTAAFEVYNATWIGAGGNAGGANNNAFTIRDYASPRIYNSIMLAFSNGGVSIDSTAGTHLTSGSLDFRNNIWYAFGGGDTVGNLGLTANSQVLFTDSSRSNLIINPLLKGARRTATSGLDPRPDSASPVYTKAKATSSDSFYLPSNYIGAFNDVNWAADWSVLTFYGIMKGDGAGTPVLKTSTLPPLTEPMLSSIMADGNIQITFPTQTGRTYHLQAKESLANSWGNVGSAVVGTGADVTINNTVTGTNQFFRIMAQ